MSTGKKKGRTADSYQTQRRKRQNNCWNNSPGTWRTCPDDLEVQEGLEDLVVRHLDPPVMHRKVCLFWPLATYILIIFKCVLPFLPEDQGLREVLGILGPQEVPVENK